jgi:hypothetical protein
MDWIAAESQAQKQEFDVFDNGSANAQWPETHLAPRTPAGTVWEVGGKVWPGQVESLAGRRLHALLSHWPWGYAPDIYQQVMISSDPVSITILREPAARALSSYYYSLLRGHSSGANPMKQQKVSRMVSEATIENFEDWLSNYDLDYYARWFSWPASQDDPSMANARKNLSERIDIVGITERYEDLVDLCHVSFGLTREYEHVNKTVDRYPFRKKKKYFGLDDLPSRVEKKLSEKTAKDRELYEVAKARFVGDFSKVKDAVRTAGGSDA